MFCKYVTKASVELSAEAFAVLRVKEVHWRWTKIMLSLYYGLRKTDYLHRNSLYLTEIEIVIDKL